MADEENSNTTDNKQFWRELVLRYWYIALIFGIIIVGALLGFLFNLNLYVQTSPIGGGGSWTFNDFSLGELVVWFLFLIVSMLVVVIVPTFIIGAAVAGIVWFKILPLDDKERIKMCSRRPKPKKASSGGGAFGFLLFIGVCIKVYIDGNWLTKFGNLSYNYFIQSWITVFIWALIIFGIPLVIIGVLWLLRVTEQDQCTKRNDVQL